MSECDREASTHRKIWLTRGCLAVGEGGNILEPHVLIVKHGIFKYSLQTELKIIPPKRLILVFVLGDSHFPMKRHTQLFVIETIINQKGNTSLLLCKYSKLLANFQRLKVCTFCQSRASRCKDF